MYRLLFLAMLCLLFTGCAHDLPLDYPIGGVDVPIPENAIYLGRSRWTGKVLFADAPAPTPGMAGK